MSMPARVAALALAAALGACASTAPGAPLAITALPAAVPTDAERDVALGELTVTGRGNASSAVYGPFRVAGPGVNLTYVGEGAWDGTLAGRSVRVVASPGKIQGTGVNLYLFQDGQKVIFRGLLGQREVVLTLTPETISGRTSSKGPGFELKRDAPGQWSGTWGPGARVFLTAKGEAVGYPAVHSPQFYLALLGMLL